MPESKADLLASVNEAAGLVQKVFFTYLLVSLYLAVLIGSTTHEQLLRESGVQLPLFGVGLSVFWVYAVAPWLFLALHVNLLVQHYLLSRKLHAFDRALKTPSDEDRPLSPEEEHEWRVRLYPSMFAQMLVGAEHDRFKGFVLRSIVFLTVAVAPVVLLLWTQIRFLPYHSELVTWGNRAALFVDLVLLWYYWPQFWQGDQSAASEVGRQDRWHLAEPVACIVSVLVLYFSMFIAVVPGGIVEQLTTVTDEDWWRNEPGTVCYAAEEPASDDEDTAADQEPSIETAEEQTSDDEDTAADQEPYILASFRKKVASFRERVVASVPKCLRRQRGHVRSCLVRHLDVREMELLAEEPSPELLAALVTDGNNKDENEDPDKTLRDKTLRDKTLRERTTGLELEGRDLRGAILREADLTKADLSNASLNGACLSGTTLTGAILTGAVLHSANLTNAKLQEADLGGVVITGKVLQRRGVLRPGSVLPPAHGARLIGINLNNVTMTGADLSRAYLWGANLQSVVFERAVLKEAQLQGANLRRAHLIDADLTGADLRGVDLRFVNIRGTTTFRGADLKYADLRNLRLGIIEEEPTAPRDRRKRPDKEFPEIEMEVEVHELSVFSDAKESEAFCSDKPSENVTCVEVTNYASGLVNEVFKPLFCQSKQRLSDAELAALLDALTVRAITQGDDHEGGFWPLMQEALLDPGCRTDWSDEQRKEIKKLGAG